MRPTRLGRPAERQEWIVQELREQIVRGDLAPGSRLPTRDELGATFGASSRTIQSALDRLRIDGFVQVNGCNGTRVVPEPPHLTRYAIVFPQLPHVLGWTGYFTALTREAERAEHTGERQLPRYHCWDPIHPQSGYKNYEQLYEDIRSHRLAGVIVAAWPPPDRLTKALEASSIPRIVMGSKPSLGYSRVELDNDSFWDKAFDYLQARGCRRIACIAAFNTNEWRQKFLDHVARRDMITRPFWWQVAHPHAPETAQQVAHLMLHAGQDERPDGLIISDDNFVEAATVGLLSAGRAVAGDLEVVAHCNFPHPTPAAVPVQRLGYDARAIIATSIRSLEAQRAGEPPESFCLPAVFESELVSEPPIREPRA